MDDTKAELELEAIEELEDKVAPQLAANRVSRSNSFPKAPHRGGLRLLRF